MSVITGEAKFATRTASNSDKLGALCAVAARIATTAVIVAILFVLAGAFGFGMYGLTYADRVYQGVSVAGLDVSGMTESEARSAVSAEFERYLNQPVVMSGNGSTYRLIPSQAGVAVDLDATIDLLFHYGRSGSVWFRTQQWTSSFLYGADLPAVMQVDQPKLEGALLTIAPRIIRAPSDAYIDVSAGGSPAIVPESPGVALDVTTTSAAIVAHTSMRGNEAIAIIAPAVEPAVRSSDLTAQLNQVQSTVGAALTVSGAGQYWSISQTDLKRIVFVGGSAGSVEVNRAAVTDLVKGMAKQINHPPVDAALVVNEQGNLAALPSEQSVEVDVSASVYAIMGALGGGSHDVALVISRHDPAISDAQAQTALQKAQGLVGKGLTLTWSDGTVQLGSADLIAALTITPRPGNPDPIELGFSAEVIGQLLGPIADQIDLAPSNGRYRLVNNKVKLVVKGANGRRLEIDQSTADVIGAVTAGKGTVALTVKTLTPAFSNADAKKIKLKDVLGTAYTYYGNSSDARRKNVERAVDLESGWLVAPGDTFSYFQNIGKVDEKNGFVTGLGILSDGNGGITTGPVIGGGICQVSTTIFQSAFWAGLSIVDRTAHPYWLQTYGQPPTGMKGLDAMVNIEDDLADSIDMEFQNNTGNWIAVVITADGENVTSQILGTSTGWDVSVVDGAPTISNIVSPPEEMIYQDSPELPAGEEKQVESAQEGFDATVVRITKDKDGNVIDEYTLASTYGPSYNRTLVGSGTSS